MPPATHHPRPPAGPASRPPAVGCAPPRQPPPARALADLSQRYTDAMNAAMSSSLTYDHAAGMNWSVFGGDGGGLLDPRVLVGSCPQSAADVHRLADAGVGAIVCLQQQADWDHFSIDGNALRRAAREAGVRHFVEAVEDFSPTSLRAHLPAAVAVLDAALAATAGAVYVHCTAGLGRAPATVLAHAAWARGAPLDAAAAALRAVRPCNPRLAAVRQAAADMVLGCVPAPVGLTVRANRQGAARDAAWAVAGLDVGWENRIDLPLDPVTGRRSVTRMLPPGRHEFKLVVRGEPGGNETWIAWPDWPVLDAGGGTLNNWVDVPYTRGPPTPASVAAERRLTRGDPSPEDLAIIRAALASRRRRAVAAAADPATRGVGGVVRGVWRAVAWPPR